jgi:plastocyanin
MENAVEIKVLTNMKVENASILMEQNTQFMKNIRINGLDMMQKTSFLIIALAFLLSPFLVDAVSDPESFKMKGSGYALSTDLENPEVFKAGLRLEISDLSSVVKGSLILKSNDNTLAVRMISDTWNFSYNADGSFTGKGTLYTLQNNFYELEIKGKRDFVGPNSSIWVADGILTNNEESYSVHLIFVGDDRFAEVPSQILKKVIIPKGTTEDPDLEEFFPTDISIFRGTIVQWNNLDNVDHTVQSQDGEGTIIGLFNSDVLEPGDKFEVTFDDVGTFDYLCSLHPWRTGSVIVK